MTPEPPTQPQPPTPTAAPPAGPSSPAVAAKRSAGGLIAAALSAVALLLSVVAVSVSLYALSKSGDATPVAQASPVRSGVPAVSEAASKPPAANDNPAPDASASPEPALDVLNVTASYTEAYQAQTLNPLVTGREAYLDLDEPRVLQERSVSEAYMDNGYGNGAVPFFVFYDGTSVAVAGDAGVQPADCRELIRTAPVPYNTQIPAQRNTTICVATSLEAAKNQGIQQKMVVVHVNSLGSTGRVNLTVTAWKVPIS